MYRYRRLWSIQGRWEQILHHLHERQRVRVGRDPEPSAGVVDSRSVRATDRGGPHGYDGAKQASGIKRPIMVDVPAACVGPAGIGERDGARVRPTRATPDSLYEYR